MSDIADKIVAFLSIAGIAFAALTAAVLFLMVVNISIEKEADRQVQIERYNCAYYGEFINKQAGSDVCPPTPWG